jgi:hypothetical protein
MKIKLLEKQIKILESLPEQGMGYQIVDIYLDDGSILYQKLVYNATYLELDNSELLAPERIKEIKIHCPAQ